MKGKGILTKMISILLCVVLMFPGIITLIANTNDEFAAESNASYYWSITDPGFIDSIPPDGGYYSQIVLPNRPRALINPPVECNLNEFRSVNYLIDPPVESNFIQFRSVNYLINPPVESFVEGLQMVDLILNPVVDVTLYASR